MTIYRVTYTTTGQVWLVNYFLKLEKAIDSVVVAGYNPITVFFDGHGSYEMLADRSQRAHIDIREVIE